MWSNHWSTYLIQLLIGVLFIAIYFVIFKLMIEKFDFKTPGRDESSIELYTTKKILKKRTKVQLVNIQNKLADF